MRLKHLLILPLIGLFFSLYAPTSAQATVIVGDGSAASCRYHAVKTALEQGGHIRFNCGPAVHTVWFLDQVTIAANAHIDGQNRVIFNGRQQNGLIATADYLTVSFANLDLRNGWTDEQGGGLRIGRFNTATVDNVTFSNNRALRDSQNCDGGGAIFIDWASNVTVRNSAFYGNRAQNGGGINNLRSKLTVTDSFFIDNHATHSDRINQFADCGGGGAIYIDGTRAPQHGGPDPVLLSGNQYRDNSTNNHGGALFIGVRTGEKVTVANSLFERNRADFIASMPTSGTGGAIWYGIGVGGVQGQYLTVHDSQFYDNVATMQGGGIWNSSPMTLQRVTMSGNRAVNPAPLNRDDWRKGNGGAIAVNHEAFVRIFESDLTDNHAGFNGGAISGSMNTELRNSTVAYNSGGWWRGLQQNCTHAVKDLGGNVQYVANPVPNYYGNWHASGCGRSVPFALP